MMIMMKMMKKKEFTVVAREVKSAPDLILAIVLASQ